MEKHDNDIAMRMMEFISAAKECIPVLFDNANQQERIISACRMAAKVVFAFKDTVKANPDTKTLLQEVVNVESACKKILEAVKETDVQKREPNLFKSLEESEKAVSGAISLTRIYLGKLRIVSGLNVISRLGHTKEHSPTVLEDVKPKSNSDFPSNTRESYETMIAEDILVGTLNRSGRINPPPTDLSQVRTDIAACPDWILDRLRSEYQLRKKSDAQLQEISNRYAEDRRVFDEWKDKAIVAFKKALGEKDEAVKKKMQELEQLSKAQTKQLDKDKNFLIQISLKEQEVERKQAELEELKKSEMELDIKYHSIKESLNKYKLEVEDWKRDTADRFHQVLSDKDKEIADLKETLNLLMKNDETKEQDELMNQLLDYIGTATHEIKEETKKREEILSQPIGSPTISAKNPGNIPDETEKTLLAKSNLRAKSPPFKVQLPDNQGFVVVEQKRTTTLGAVLETVCARRQITDSESWGFRHVDAPDTTPLLKLSTRLSDLAVSSVRLVKRDPPKFPTVRYFGKEAADNKIGMPYNVFHTDHRSVEHLIKMMEKNINEEEQIVMDGIISQCKGFEVELGDKNKPPLEDAGNRRLVDSDRNTPYYQHYFFNKAHVNFYSEGNRTLGPILVSLEVLEKDTPQLGDSAKLRALVRTKFDDEWVFIPANAKFIKRELLKTMEKDCRNGDKMAGIKLRKIKNPAGPKELVNMEQKLLSKGYKFGVLYCKSGQKEESEMFGNVETSKEFEEFLQFLGEKIVLSGHDGYRGGLDVKANSTGTHSIFTKHLGYQIMFHVSTLLPYSEKDTQQLERKRHLGNDVCTIVFKDTDEPFSPDTVKSEFNHVFAVVTVDKPATEEHGETYYKIAFAYKGGIGRAQPLLPFPPIFSKSGHLRDFLLTKLINSERCAMYAPDFVSKIAKTKQLQMEDVINTVKSTPSEKS